MLNKMIEIGLLLDFYGKLLTEKQKRAMTLYYFDDLSLSEISERLDISRQGVYDHLHRGEDILRGYEEKLNLIEKYRLLKDRLENMESYIEKNIYKTKHKHELKKKIKKIKETL